MVLAVKNPPANTGDVKRCGIDPWVRKIPWRKAWKSSILTWRIPVFLPGESLGRRSVVGPGRL